MVPLPEVIKGIISLGVSLRRRSILFRLSIRNCLCF